MTSVARGDKPLGEGGHSWFLNHPRQASDTAGFNSITKKISSAITWQQPAGVDLSCGAPCILCEDKASLTG